MEGYDHVLFNSSQTRLGYSGTVTYSRYSNRTAQIRIQHEVGDDEGRIIILEYPGAYVVNVYTVNSGENLRRLPVRMSWDVAFRRCIRKLRENGKPIVIVGDLNVAQHNMDVFDPKRTQGLPGFTDEERVSFEDLLETNSLVDAYRMLYPLETNAFTYWDYRGAARSGNRGWRIDYTLITDDMVNAVRDVRILEDVHGSDHCPVLIDLASSFLMQGQ